MIYNNRQPLYKPKVYPKRECVHVEIKDGVEVFIKGPEKNPFEGVDYHSLKLSSRIANHVQKVGYISVMSDVYHYYEQRINV